MDKAKLRDAVNSINPVLMMLPPPFNSPAMAPANWNAQNVQRGQELLQRILSGLGIGAQASADVPPPSEVLTPFGEPAGPSLSTILNAQGVPQQVTHMGTPEYPPPGVDTVAWAAANPPPPDQRLPSLEDMQRWQQVLDGGVTEVPKTKKPPMPDRKPKMEEEPLPWQTVITGLGPYAR